MVAMRRSLLAGLLVAIVAVVVGCADAGSGASATPGTKAWLVGTWEAGDQDVVRGAMMFRKDGSAETFLQGPSVPTDKAAFRYTLSGDTLTIIELNDAGEEKGSTSVLLEQMTATSFVITRKGKPNDKMKFTRQATTDA